MGGGGGGGKAVLTKPFWPFWPQFGIKIGGRGCPGSVQRFPDVFHIVLVSKIQSSSTREKMEIKGTSG